MIESTRTGQSLRPDVYDVIWTVLEGKLSPMVRNADLAERMAKDWARSCVDMLVANDLVPSEADTGSATEAVDNVAERPRTIGDSIREYGWGGPYVPKA